MLARPSIDSVRRPERAPIPYAAAALGPVRDRGDRSSAEACSRARELARRRYVRRTIWRSSSWDSPNSTRRFGFWRRVSRSVGAIIHLNATRGWTRTEPAAVHGDRSPRRAAGARALEDA